MPLRVSICRLPEFLQSTVAIGLVLLLLTFAPFAVAQDVHHELAAADHDGHEHSDTDLCQWVQHHTAGSLDVGAHLFTAEELVDLLDTRPVLLALLPATNHVISIRAILARLSSDCVLAVASLEHVIIRGISCDPLYGDILLFAHYVSASSV
jgi:hypothetical protein